MYRLAPILVSCQSEEPKLRLSSDYCYNRLHSLSSLQRRRNLKMGLSQVVQELGEWRAVQIYIQNPQTRAYVCKPLCTGEVSIASQVCYSLQLDAASAAHSRLHDQLLGEVCSCAVGIPAPFISDDFRLRLRPLLGLLLIAYHLGFQGSKTPGLQDCSCLQSSCLLGLVDPDSYRFRRCPYWMLTEHEVADLVLVRHWSPMIEGMQSNM